MKGPALRRHRRFPPGPAQPLPALLDANRFVDDRLASTGFVRRNLNKVFPDHWSFMLGEIALYAFVVLLVTGTYLTLFFHASLAEHPYQGSYIPLRGVTVTDAYSSTLDISFDVRAGLVIRQIHHWAALLFVAAIIVHCCRVFFTGAFRKPRDINWMVGVGLLLLAIAEGFAGYSLPDDLLSGTGLRIGYSIAESIPLVGTWAAFLFWGGEYPGTEIIGRLFVVHILVVPGLIVALLSAHMGILWHQKHTDFPGPGKTEDNIVGSRLFPSYAMKSAGFFMLVFGTLALLGGLAQINPIWLYGPYDPADASAGSQPDWYVGFMDGGLRLMPHWELRALGHTVPLELLLPGVVLPLLLFGLLAGYPFLERAVTRDRGQHNLLDRPRDHPVRTGLGVMSLTFYAVLLFAGGDDVIATIFGTPLNTTIWVTRVALLVAPGLAYTVTRRYCVGLQRNERERQEEGLETGVLRQLPAGEFVEVTVALRPPQEPDLVPADRTSPPAGDADRPHRLAGALNRAGRAFAGFFVAGQDRDGARDPQPDRAQEPEKQARR